MASVNNQYLTSLELTQDQWLQMHNLVARQPSVEVCGLLGGAGNRVMIVIPVTNILTSSTRFLMEPQEQICAFKTIEDYGWVMVGIYHSHPKGPETPSKTDIHEAYYPDAAYLIWLKQSGRWGCHAFRIINGLVNEIDLRIIKKRVTFCTDMCYLL
jgi:proteasome lid subunit RPN8/RPN11